MQINCQGLPHKINKGRHAFDIPRNHGWA